MKSRYSLFCLIFCLGFLFGSCSLSPAENNLPEASYKIGDRGPGGGWIFLDKGSLSDGWRYLEAAPDDLGQTEWGCVGLAIPDARETGTGGGSRNTRAIVNKCEKTEGAAHLADNDSIGGKKDWFLPSRDELNAMYINLHQKGMGNLKELYYWSSSEYGSVASWYQSFGIGDQSYSDKDYPFGLVRPVRAFLEETTSNTCVGNATPRLWIAAIEVLLKNRLIPNKLLPVPAGKE